MVTQLIQPISNAMTLGVLMDTPDPGPLSVGAVGILLEVGPVGAGVVKLPSKSYNQNSNSNTIMISKR